MQTLTFGNLPQAQAPIVQISDSSASLILSFRRSENSAPRMRYSQGSIEERDEAVERLREFLRFNYMTGAQAAQRMGVNW